MEWKLRSISTLSKNSHFNGFSGSLRQIYLSRKSEPKIQNEFMHHKVYSSRFQCNCIYQNQASSRRLTVALNCWSLYLGSMLRRKWASTVSTNLVLAVSLTKDIAVFKSYSFLRSLNCWISKNLLDLVWWGNERTISLEIKGKSITSSMKISTTQTNTSILEEVKNWFIL